MTAKLEEILSERKRLNERIAKTDYIEVVMRNKLREQVRMIDEKIDMALVSIANRIIQGAKIGDDGNYHVFYPELDIDHSGSTLIVLRSSVTDNLLDAWRWFGMDDPANLESRAQEYQRNLIRAVGEELECHAVDSPTIATNE